MFNSTVSWEEKLRRHWRWCVDCSLVSASPGLDMLYCTSCSQQQCANQCWLWPTASLQCFSVWELAGWPADCLV